MARKHHKPEEIVAKLRQVEVLVGQGKPVTEATYYRWRSEFGGLKLDQVKRLKVLEQENGRLRQAVADLDAGEAGAEGSCLGKLVSAPPDDEVVARTSSGVRRARHGQAGRFRAFCLQGAGSASLDAAQISWNGRRRGGADGSDHRLGAAVWPIRLPAGSRPCCGPKGGG